jgi:hypothetical protein
VVSPEDKLLSTSWFLLSTRQVAVKVFDLLTTRLSKVVRSVVVFAPQELNGSRTAILIGQLLPQQGGESQFCIPPTVP